jgi:large subunit ribosomal protein L18e
MPHPTGPTDPHTQKLINKLSRKKEKFYLVLARHLAKPARNKKPVNVTKIQRVATEKDVIAVPGKVLGAGEITKAVTVYALHFSKEAEQKITKAGGKCLHLDHLDKKARILI